VGFGLVIAVLGIGSTFAANIQINNNADIEFGRGFTQTVFCGGEQEVTVAPISTYVDPVLAASATSLLDARFGVTYWAGNVTGSYIQRNTGFTTVNGIEGFWLTKVGNNPPITIASNQSPTAVQANIGEYVFSPKVNRDGTVGVYKVKTFTTAPAVITPAVETGFRVGGVLISNIPSQCEGVNFVIRAFAETGTAKTLISGQISADNFSVDITEIAALWTGSPGETTPSSDRTKLVTASPLVTALEGVGSLKITFNKASGRNLMDADDLDKLTVETQKDALIP
jgi:hypothetical protein